MARFIPAKLAHIVAEAETGANENLCPIIFLHGLTGWKEMWGELPQEVANATKRKAYVVDQRNHGDAEWSDDFNFDMLTTDLLHFMDTNKIRKAIIIGMSMGGTVAINLALTNPEKVEALFVLDMIVGKYAASLIELIKSGMYKVHNLLKLLPVETDGEKIMRTLCDELEKLVPEGLAGKGKEQMINSYLGFLKRKENGQWSARTNIDVLIRALDNPDSLMTDPEGIYSGLAIFIYGTESILDFAANEARIKQHFPKVEMVPIQGSSHNIIADSPEMLRKTLLEFLSKM